MTSLAVKLLIGACCVVGVVLVVLLSVIGYHSHVTSSQADNSIIDYRGNDVISGRAPSAGRQSVRWSPDQCAYANVTSRPRYVGDTVASVLCTMVDTRCSLMYSSSLGYTTAASISFISPSGTLIAVATTLSKSRLLFTLTWTGAYMCTISVYNRTLGRVAAINTTFTLPPVSLLPVPSCATNPCENGGTCSDMGTVRCVCPSPWSGGVCAEKSLP